MVKHRVPGFILLQGTQELDGFDVTQVNRLRTVVVTFYVKVAANITINDLRSRDFLLAVKVAEANGKFFSVLKHHLNSSMCRRSPWVPCMVRRLSATDLAVHALVRTPH